MKILLADDNPEVRSALRLLLEQEPVISTITEATDAMALLTRLNENCPGVILLDWELPGLWHGDLLSAARSCCPEAKIIALSSKFEARQESLAARMDAFISKSDPPEKILSTLRSFLPHSAND